MQEVEKLKLLQTEREALKSRIKVKEQEKKDREPHRDGLYGVRKQAGSSMITSVLALVCQSCGLVIDDDFIDRGPEWRAFDHDQRMKRSRVGAPMTFTIHDKGLSTMIDWRNRDSYGRAISSKNRAHSTVSASGSAVSVSAMQLRETSRLHSPNLTVWPRHWVSPETSVRPPPWSTVTRWTRT